MRAAHDDPELTQVNLEVAAEEVGEAKRLLVELDRRQNQFREARRALTNMYRDMNEPQPSSSSSSSLMRKRRALTEPVFFLCSGSTFVGSELNPEDTLRYLTWRMNTGEEEIERARDDLKQKVVTLAELEGPDSALAHLYQGFALSGSRSSPTASV